MKNFINNQNWCDIKQYDVKEFKLSMLYLMTCVNCLNFDNNYGDNFIISHIHTVCMTYSVTYTLYT